MAKYIITVVLIVFPSCFSKDKDQSKQFPVNQNELLYKKGNVVSIKTDSSITSVGLIADVRKDEGGIWYGICFTNYADSTIIDTAKLKYLSVYGRKIASSIDNRGYIKAIDVCFVHDSAIKTFTEKIKIISNLRLRSDIHIGANTSATKFEDLLIFYNNGRQRRLQLPDDYRNHFKENFRADQYLSIQDFVEPIQ